MANSFTSPRHSTREKRPPAVDDLGYTNRELLKRAGKGAVEAFKKCERVLMLLKKHQHSKNFLYPVTAPGYSNVVKEPMDLATAEKKLKAGAYTSSHLFAADIRKIWNNAWSYNQPGSPIYIATTSISNYFEGLMREIEDVQFTPETNEAIQQLKKQVTKANERLKKITGSGMNLTLQRANSSNSRKPTERPMTSKERSILAQKIQRLSKEKPLEIINILKDVLDFSTVKDEVEFDLERLSTRKCRELDLAVRRALVSSKAKSKKKKIDPSLNITPTKEIPRIPAGQIQSSAVAQEDGKDDSLSKPT